MCMDLSLEITRDIAVWVSLEEAEASAYHFNNLIDD